jgi:hypothetical protein
MLSTKSVKLRYNGETVSDSQSPGPGTTTSVCMNIRISVQVGHFGKIMVLFRVRLVGLRHTLYVELS